MNHPCPMITAPTTVTCHRNIEYRLLPGTKAKARKLAAQAGACRFVWNEMLGQQKSAYEEAKAMGMTSSAKGTVEAPGKNVRAKSGLNREILATGWHALVQMLGYKCREVITINPAYTSQTCNVCQQVNKESRKGRSYKCVACGHADHADVNAAHNILSSGADASRMTASGIGAAARRGALALATPLIREIDRIGDYVNYSI